MSAFSAGFGLIFIRTTSRFQDIDKNVLPVECNVIVILVIITCTLVKIDSTPVHTIIDFFLHWCPKSFSRIMAYYWLKLDVVMLYTVLYIVLIIHIVQYTPFIS
jgi:formate-dependent nitrite reductase membrane component NrfD